ncbi:hypothetical protein EZV62_007803 [Acer yangbiense]|uniref:DUF4283 domain-containing protein n=1 Tax=Acer yangbiense TaxID=1000413 RepID=A0A5C7IBJ4_9ROSI|nr:hypothetical protein EZV62_007803 [Acer yangbiense]
MSEPEIAQLYANLSLADEDGEVHDIPSGEIRDEEVAVGLCLVGKILSSKKVNRDAFIHLIEQLWSPFGRVGIELVEVNVFLFKFNNQEERNRIWQRGPWYFDKSLIVLVKPKGMGHASKDCEDVEAKREALERVSTKFGSWMRAPGLDWQKPNMMTPVEGSSQIQRRFKGRSERKGQDLQLLRAGSVQRAETDGNHQHGGSGSVDVQLVKRTDAVWSSKEDSSKNLTNILDKFDGSGSTHVHGLLLPDPSEEASQGGFSLGSGPMGRGDQTGRVVSDLQMEGPTVGHDSREEKRLQIQLPAEGGPSPKKLTTRNWKRSARAKKAEVLLSQPSRKFRDLQTVSMKGKQSFQGNGSSSTSKSKFHLVGKRSGLGKYHKSVPMGSKPRGTLFSSLKRWEVQFGKHQLIFGPVLESDRNKQDSGWSQIRFKNLSNQISGKNRELEHLYGFCEADGVMTEIKELEKSVEDLMDSEELYWKQRSRAEWLEAGDRNSKFFHARATARHKKNSIHRLQNREGRLEDSEAGMARVIQEFFQSLFQSANPSPSNISSASQCISSSFTQSQFIKKQFQSFRAATPIHTLFTLEAVNTFVAYHSSSVYHLPPVVVDLSSSVGRLLLAESPLAVFNSFSRSLISKVVDSMVSSFGPSISVCVLSLKQQAQLIITFALWFLKYKLYSFWYC